MITGGASGLGLEIARLAAKKGMKLVLSDIEERALNAAESEFSEQGIEVLAVRTNVAIARGRRVARRKNHGAFWCGAFAV